VSAAARLGEALRHLGSVLNAGAVQSEDDARVLHKAPPLDARAAQIRKEATSAAKRLRP